MNENNEWNAQPSFASVSGKDFLANSNLQQEVFGPFTLTVVCDGRDEVLQVASCLHGQLTSTIMANDDEANNYSDLLEILAQKAGRVIYNGVPTGVEVCQAMHHGGPFPASSNGAYTSVGVEAAKRFVRPVSFQNIPDSLLPDELKSANPLGIWRTVNGQKTK